MSFASRLANVRPNRANHGCQTCLWLESLTDADRASFDSWIVEGNSVAQLWEIAASMEDNPLTVSNTGLRSHVRHHKVATNES